MCDYLLVDGRLTQPTTGMLYIINYIHRHEWMSVVVLGVYMLVHVCDSVCQKRAYIAEMKILVPQQSNSHVGVELGLNSTQHHVVGHRSGTAGGVLDCMECITGEYTIHQPVTIGANIFYLLPRDSSQKKIFTCGHFSQETLPARYLQIRDLAPIQAQDLIQDQVLPFRMHVCLTAAVLHNDPRRAVHTLRGGWCG